MAGDSPFFNSKGCSERNTVSLLLGELRMQIIRNKNLELSRALVGTKMTSATDADGSSSSQIYKC